MTSRERVEAAAALQPTDKVPIHHIGFSSQVAYRLLGREAYVGGGIQQWREALALLNGPDAHREYLDRSYRDALDIAEFVGQDIVRPSHWRLPQMPTRRLNEHTILYAGGPEESWFELRFDPEGEQCAIQPCHERPPTFDTLDQDLRRQEGALEAWRPEASSFAAEIRAQREIGRDKAIRCGGVPIGIMPESLWIEAMVARPDLVERHLDLQVAHAERNVPFLVERGLTWIFGAYTDCDGGFP